MEQVGDGDINTNVDMAGSIVNAFKDGGNSVGDVHTDIALMHDQEGTGDVSGVEPLVLDKISTNEVVAASVMEGKKKESKRRRQNKKPPDAPKRFKSSFIFFSVAKHKEIRESLKAGEDLKAKNVTMMVSEAWRALEPLEREKFEEMARQDKARYNIEKRNYVPPPGMSLTSKRKRDPDAPKRPMSAYLSYANKLRAKVKAENQNCTNGEISKILSRMWKGMSDDERKQYKDNEQILWDIYREKMVVWKRNNDGRKKGTKTANGLLRHNMMRSKKKKKDNHNMGSIDFSSHVVNDTGVDEQLLGLGSVPGIDTNPNTDEIMAASALRGVRGGSQQHLGLGSGGVRGGSQQHLGLGSGDPSQNSGYNGFFGANSNATAGQAGFGQMEMTGFPYNQYGYPLGGNTHAMIMAQLRGNPHQQYPGFMPIDQQANLSQLASLAGVQNDVTQQQQQQQLQQSIDQPGQPSAETGLSIEIGNGNLGNLNDNSGGDNTSF